MANHYPLSSPKTIDLGKGNYRHVRPDRSRGGGSYRSRVRALPPRQRGAGVHVRVPDIQGIGRLGLRIATRPGNIAWIWREMIILLEEAQAARPIRVEIPEGSAWNNARRYECPTGGPPDRGPVRGATYAITQGSSSNNCIGGQYVNGNNSPLSVGFWHKTSNLGPRYRHVVSFVRNSGSLADPMPYIAPAVPAKPAVWGNFRYREAVRGAPEADMSISAEPSAPGAAASPRLPRPPSKGTKERKAMLAIHPRSIWGRGISAAGELSEVIDCLHKALPRGYRAPRKSTVDFVSGRRYRRKASALEKAEAVYNNFDRVDLGSALACLAANHYEDIVYGRLGRVTAEANRRRGSFGGVALGPAL